MHQQQGTLQPLATVTTSGEGPAPTFTVRVPAPEPLRQITVRFDKIGFHFYPEAPQEVSYLQYRHRHKFFFEVTLQVFHNDREVEFHMFLNWILGLYENNLEVDYKSCEMIAEELAPHIHKKYGTHRLLSISVFEDNECGATLTWPAHKDYNVPERRAERR